MSQTNTDVLAAPGGGAISLSSGASISSKGMVVQTITTRTDARTTYAAPITGNGTTITDLNLTITPKFASSLLIMRWMINSEVQQGWNTSFLVHRNGALITDAGYEGYNSQAGNVRWSGFSPAATYDNNDDSTLTNMIIQYAVPAGSTTSQTFAPAIRSATTAAYTMYLNRTIFTTGADNYEVTVSNGIIWEVVQ